MSGQDEALVIAVLVITVIFLAAIWITNIFSERG